MPGFARKVSHPFRRRTYVIDRPLQFGVAGQLLAGLGLVALMYAAGMIVFLGQDAMKGISVAVVREFIFTANAVYFLLAAAILTILTLLLTHRFAGPAYVMDLAIQGMLKGDYGRRLALRKRDYLKPLAAGLEQLRTEWIRHDGKVREALNELAVCLREGDVEAAEKIVTRLQARRMVQPGTVPVTEPAVAPKPQKTPEPVAS